MAQDSSVKQKIFLASAELFGQRSYSRVSMRDVAQATGIKPATIYYYYQSKSEILDDLITHYIRQIDLFSGMTQELVSNTLHQPKLSDVRYIYSTEEARLMFWITRIICMEQFTHPRAADALIGQSNRRYTLGYRHFFHRLWEIGYIKNEANIPWYAEIFTRMGHSFQLDFVHPEFDPIVKDLTDMYLFILKLILAREGSLEHYGEIVG